MREWSSLVNPGVSVSSFITGLTGIDDRMVESAPRFEQLAAALQERLRGRLFVAHNARFDYGFLKAEFARLGIEFKAPALCTVKLSRKLYPQHHRHNLDTLMQRHAVLADARHRALADARVLWDLWQAWHRELGAEAVQAGVARLTHSVTLPPQLDPALADELPECHGAYALLDAEGNVLQVGRAPNLRQKVLSNFADARGTVPPASLTHSVEWRPAAGELGARLAELALQRRSKPIPPDLCAWRLHEHGPGDFRPVLVMAAQADGSPEYPEFGGAAELFGLYSTAREARQALRKLAEAHFLCPALLGLEAHKDGKPCGAVKTHHCRGACAGKEPLSKHSARLMTALAKLRLRPWPNPGLAAGPVAIVERDEFGMMEDFHVVDRWRWIGCVRDEAGLAALLETLDSVDKYPFDPDIYRALLKYFHAEKLRIIPLPAQLPASH